MSTVDPLQDAVATEEALRAQLGELVGAKVRAEQESARLRDRATLPGADPAIGALADDYAAQAVRLTAEVEEVRAALRAQEGRTETLRAAGMT
ncbi:MAG: hypothetical protein JWP18_1425 [Solirubrobacterales bacterium]|jgi:hypothetical protein|nr:hypothetical protein [Solirubrobacterales bacterium]